MNVSFFLAPLEAWLAQCVPSPLVRVALVSHVHTAFLFVCSPFWSLVGTSGLEPPTSRLSGARSNHLSYAPLWLSLAVPLMYLWWR